MAFERAERTGAQALLDALEREGADVIFGYPGGAIMPLYDALFGHRIRHVLVRHEAAAAFAASGYARSSGRVGVCAATSGPGATNLVTGIVDAMMDSVPLVAITGQVRTPLMGTDAFQEADIAAITHAITKRNLVVRSVDEIAPAIHQAFRLARGPRPGPVLIDVPSDVLKALTTPDASTTPQPLEARAVPVAAPDAIAAAVRIFHKSKRPVAIAGGGVRSPRAVRAYRRLCERLGIPQTATINGLGAARPGDTRFLGMLGMHGSKAANLAVCQADLILAFGMRFDDRVTGRVDRFAPGAAIVHADIDAAEFGKIVRTDVALHGDVADTLELLDAALGNETSNHDEWFERAWALGGPLPCDRTPGKHPKATDVLDALFDAMPADAVVTTDVGQHQMWAAQRARPSQPRNFLTSAGLGAMGFGVPAAIGAAFADRTRPVFAIVGDGGFQMSFAELATLRRYEVPVKILLIDNRNLGMVRQWQQLFYDARYSATNLSDNPDFCAIAAAYGMKSERLDDAGEMRGALARFVAEPGAMLLHCACYPEENVWPMVPAGAALDELMEAAV